jgi:Tol biopolymer transport system component
VSKQDGTCDLMMVTIADEPQFKRLHTAQNPGFDIAWHPDGDRIAIPLQDPEHGRLQIYTLNPETDDAPVRLDGQDPQRRNVGVCWSADGRELIVVSYDR